MHLAHSTPMRGKNQFEIGFLRMGQRTNQKQAFLPEEWLGQRLEWHNARKWQGGPDLKSAIPDEI
jgi:hypothetical protein